MRPTPAHGTALVWTLLVVGAVHGDGAVLLPPVPPGPPVLAAQDLEPAKDAAESDDPGPVRIPEMLGDQAPIGSLLHLPAGRIQGAGVLYVPSVRYFKISDNDSPQPRNRSYLSFNYFRDAFDDVNRTAGGGITRTRFHRETFGAEWADADGSASLGLRLPLNTYNAQHTVPGLDGTSTDVGDLSIIFKWLLWQQAGTGRLVSAGLAVTAPTGPGSFAGSNHLRVFHNTILQPYVGWTWTWGDVYLQGFTAVDAPCDLNDVVVLDNSVSAGYLLYQNFAGRGLTAIVPTVEVHVNTPLNHRGILRLTDPAGTPDMVNITGGLQLEYRDRSSLAVGFVRPVTGPRQFDFEILAQYRYRY